MATEFKQIGLRIKGLRESGDLSQAQVAAELGVPVETYAQWEDTGADVPISALYHLANKFGVDMTAIITGVGAKLDTYQVVRKGEGKTVDRYPGYRFQDLAWLYSQKVMQPLLVTLDPSDAPAALVTHGGQEFNMVLQGSMVVTFGDREIVLGTGDSIYFNPTFSHGQRCAGEVPAVFVTVIAE